MKRTHLAIALILAIIGIACGSMEESRQTDRQTGCGNCNSDTIAGGDIRTGANVSPRIDTGTGR